MRNQLHSRRLTHTHYAIILFTLVLTLFALPVTSAAQSGALPSPGASSSDGLFLHARLGGHGMAFDGIDDADGQGIGLRAGYGFSDRFTLYLGVEGANLKGGTGFEGLGPDEEYGLAYVELGSRFHFRQGRALVPYADLAVSVIGLGYDGAGDYANEDITYGGLGASLGGGVLYFVSPTFALEGGLAFTPGSLMEQDIEGRGQDVDIALAGVRLHIGATFYPFR